MSEFDPKLDNRSDGGKPGQSDLGTQVADSWKPVVAGCMTFLVCLSLLAGIVFAYQRDNAQREKLVLSTLLSEASSVFSLALAAPMASLEALASTVQADAGFAIANFDLIAESVAGNVPAVISLQLAPGAIVRHVTNRERNLHVLGHDLFSDPVRGKVALRSRAERAILIEGPTQLLQGGTGLIIRKPIFLKASDLPADGFWGFATVVLDAGQLFKLALAVVPQNVQVALRGRDASGPDGEVFHGEAKVFDRTHVSSSIRFGNKSWQLAMAHSEPSGLRLAAWELAALAAGLFASAVSAYIAWLLMSAYVRGGLERTALLLRSRTAESQADRHLETVVQSRLDLADLRRDYRLLAENASDYIVLYDRDGKVLFDSPSFIRLMGSAYRADRTQGLYLLPEDRARASSLFSKLRDEGGEGAIEFRLLLPSGDPLWVEGRCVAIPGPDGKTSRLLAVHRDIQERKLGELKLIESEERLRLVTENLVQMLSLYDESEKLIYASSSLITFLGIDANANSVRFGGHVHPDDREVFEKLLSELRDGQGVGEALYRVQRFDGEYRWFQVNARLVRSDGAHRALFVVSATDVSDRRESEQRAEKAERLYRLLAENTYDWITLWSVDGHALYDSPSSARYVQEKRSSGRYIGDQIVGAQQEQVRTLFRELVRDGGSREVECEILTGSGRRIWFEARFVAITGSDGKTEAVISTRRDLTGRRESERRLVESEARLRAILDNTQDIVMLIERSGEASYVNRTFERILGKPQPGHRFGDNLHPDDRSRVLRIVGEVFNSESPEKPMLVEFRYITKAGEIRWVQTNASAVLIDGQVSLVAGIARDITETRNLQEELARSERLYRLLAENTEDWITLWSAEGKAVYDSPSALKAFGAMPELGRSFDTFLTSERDRKAASQLSRELTAKPGHGEMDLQIACADGRVRWFNALTVSVAGPDGKVEYAITVRRDITQRRAFEDRLASSEEQYRLLAEYSSDFVFLYSQDGSLRYASPAFARFLGMPEIAFASFEDVVDPRDLPKVRASFEAVLAKTPGVFCRYRVMKATGETAWLEAAASAVLNHEGQVESVVSSVRDVTDRQLAEERLARSEANYRLLADNAVEFISLWNREGIATYDSPSVQRLLGRDFREARRIGAEVHPDDREALVAALYQIVDIGGVARVKYRIMAGNAAGHWFEGHLTAVIDEHGAVDKVLLSVRDIEDFIVTQNQLQDERERLGTLLQAAPQLRYFVTNLTRDRWYYMSPSMLEYWGLQESKFSETDFTRLDRQAVFKADIPAYLGRSRLEAKGQAAELIYQIRHPQLGRRFTRTRTLPVTQADGSIRIYGVSEDVTETRVTQIDFGLLQRRYESSLNASRSFVIEADRRLRSLYLSDSITEVLGYPTRRPDGTYFGLPDLVSESKVGAGRVMRALERCLQDGMVIRDLMLHFKHADGHQVSMIMHAAPLLSDDNRVRGLQAVCTDVTQLEMVERQLRERGALFESILEYTQDIVTLISRDGELLLRGKRGAELFPDNTNVEDSFSVVVEQDREAARTTFKQLLTRGGTRHLQYRMKIPSGEVRYMDAIGTAIPDDQHKVAAVLVIARDVTDTVQARAREEQSQRLEAIGQLTGGLAHDFNNLLGIVIGCLDDMDVMLPDDATLRRRQRIAMEAAQRGAQITRSLLTVARRQSVELKLHDLNALVTDLLPLLRSSIGPTPQLQTDLADTGLMVMVDADAVSNVLINLVINSRDACLGLGGEHHVVIRTLRQKVGSGEDRDLEPGWYAVLQVQDDGSGITTEVRERAFDPFFTTKKSGDGTGLGLSMVYGYARQMHGTARIEETSGGWTTVSVLLPLPSQDSGSAGRRSDESASTHDQEPSPGDQRESTDGTGAALEHTAAPRVLVVDDEEGLCELGCAWMQALGLTAVGAGNADEALEILATQSFDVLFTDIVMPGSMNGVELAKRVKERYPQVRVILTSGNAGMLSAQGVELPGLLVEKPYRKPELANALRQVGVEPPKAVGRR